jgi:hypothetical protein
VFVDVERAHVRRFAPSQAGRDARPTEGVAQCLALVEHATRGGESAWVRRVVLFVVIQQPDRRQARVQQLAGRRGG